MGEGGAGVCPASSSAQVFMRAGPGRPHTALTNTFFASHGDGHVTLHNSLQSRVCCGWTPTRHSGPAGYCIGGGGPHPCHMTPATLTTLHSYPPLARQSIPPEQHASTKRFRRTTLCCAPMAGGGAWVNPSLLTRPLAAARRHGNQAA